MVTRTVLRSDSMALRPAQKIHLTQQFLDARANLLALPAQLFEFLAQLLGFPRGGVGVAAHGLKFGESLGAFLPGHLAIVDGGVALFDRLVTLPEGDFALR